MKIIVTGHTGLLGRNLAERLIAKGYTVFGLARGRKPFNANPNKKLVQIETDLTSFNSVKKACRSIRNVKYVFHTATVHPTKNRTEITDYLNTNFIGAINLLRTCEECGFKNIIASSSFSVYGNPYYLPIDEKHPTRPNNFYGMTKLQADLSFEFYARKLGFNITILRYDGIYGIGESVPGFIQYLLNSFLSGKDVKLFNNGRQKRDNVYVDDAVEANIKAMYALRKAKGKVFNIGGGVPKTSFERARIVRDILGSRSRIILSKKKNPLMDYDIFLDITEAKRVLGYKPKDFRQNMISMLEKMDRR